MRPLQRWDLDAIDARLEKPGTTKLQLKSDVRRLREEVDRLLTKQQRILSLVSEAEAELMGEENPPGDWE